MSLAGLSVVRTYPVRQTFPFVLVSVAVLALSSALPETESALIYHPLSAKCHQA